MDHDTENLHLDSDGVLYLKVFTRSGEDDEDCTLKRLGGIEGASYDVPREFGREYDELLDLWTDQQSGACGYAAAVEMGWRRAKGL
jgi:hypothetical protein